MRILLTANASYAPPRGGATRSNLIWLDHLARAGPRVPDRLRRVRARARNCGITNPSRCSRWKIPARRMQVLRQQIREFQPDWVLVSSRRPGARPAARGASLRARAASSTWRTRRSSIPSARPVGIPTAHAAELVAQSAGIVAIGHHMADYIERELGRAAAVIHPPIYGAGPFPNFGKLRPRADHDDQSLRGEGHLDLSRGRATRLPAHEFGVVPGWGTTAEDRRDLLRLPNVRILPNARNIDDVLARTRVLLMPSLWYEGFGLIVMESMLRGIPVVASDSGGLKEAKRGTGYVIPVQTIERYQPVFDEHAMPKPVVQPNDLAPWVAALEELLADRAAYERESARVARRRASSS